MANPAPHFPPSLTDELLYYSADAQDFSFLASESSLNSGKLTLLNQANGKTSDTQAYLSSSMDFQLSDGSEAVSFVELKADSTSGAYESYVQFEVDASKPNQAAQLVPTTLTDQRAVAVVIQQLCSQVSSITAAALRKKRLGSEGAVHFLCSGAWCIQHSGNHDRCRIHCEFCVLPNSHVLVQDKGNGMLACTLKQMESYNFRLRNSSDSSWLIDHLQKNRLESNMNVSEALDKEPLLTADLQQCSSQKDTFPIR